jgi:hypothetical protein
MAAVLRDVAGGTGPWHAQLSAMTDDRGMPVAAAICTFGEHLDAWIWSDADVQMRCLSGMKREGVVGRAVRVALLPVPLQAARVRPPF